MPRADIGRITFVAGLRRNGMTAPCVIDGVMTGRTFLAYVEQCLGPPLKRNDVDVIDNRPTKAVRACS